MKQIAWISTLTAAVVLGLVVTRFPAEAHHSAAPFYHTDQEVEIVGTVVRFNFRNPHSFIYIEAETPAGQMVEYEVELGAAVSMSRNGWTRESVSTGDPIRAVGSPSRAEGTFGMCCAELTLPDGSPIRLVRLEMDASPLGLVVMGQTVSAEE